MACIGTDTLVAIIDGRAPPELRAEVERHAADCGACRELMSSLVRSEPVVANEATQIGRYVVSATLGAGGMGVVYAAFDPELGRTVAIKVMHARLASPEMQVRLRREAQAMAQLAHPNVLTVYDVGTHEHHLFIAMEYVKGETLASWQRGRSAAAIIGAYLDAARGLASAHAAGIVHRDFKPDNVLIGDDGRVRVADFGLASMGSSTELEVVGTPYFIAPELHAGGEADGRSDQYSWARALSRALGGAAPRRARKVLARAMAEDPADRFPTMTALIAQLAPRRGRAIWALGAAAVVAVTAIAVPRHTEDICARAGDGIAEVWNAPARSALDRAITATRLPYAAATSRALDRSIDQYASAWSTMRIGACRATHDRGEQSAELLDRRMQCLDERRRALAQLIESVRAAAPTTIEHAMNVATSLPSIVDCADTAALVARVPLPSAAIKARVDALNNDIAAVETRREAGEYAPALATANALLAQATALAYRPLEARAALAVGKLQRSLERFDDARATLDRAVLAAEAGGDDRTRARALVELTGIVGSGLRLAGDAAALRARADAAVERLGRPAALQIALLELTGELAFASGKLEDAQRSLTASLAIAETTYGEDDLRLVSTLHHLAKLELQRSNASDAEALLVRARGIQERVLDASHPQVAETVSMLAGVAYEQNDYDGAEQLYLRALAIQEAALGPDSLAIASTLSNLGNVYQWQGKPEAAVEVDRRAVAIAAARLGEHHALVLTIRGSLASALADLDEHTEALAELASILPDQRRLLGEHQDTAVTLQLMAHVEVELHRYAPARDHAQEALAMMERVLGDTYHPVDELLTLGRAYLGLREYALSAETLARARAETSAEVDPSTVAWIDAELGRALVDSGRDVARGRALVIAGRAKLREDAERSGQNLAELAAWTRSRHIPD